MLDRYQDIMQILKTHNFIGDDIEDRSRLVPSDENAPCDVCGSVVDGSVLEGRRDEMFTHRCCLDCFPQYTAGKLTDVAMDLLVVAMQFREVGIKSRRGLGDS